ncbi:hypothetical protein [Corynebacterium lactis]|uniref:Uncharacterized protein n=1 Tax=Corynebacterium lactis RW2-5 TaxID=1408189 RepID=A0A0K2H335_9CORY|nr:hypothetical protein [Corynebacterium lactis]ALA68442.1 hypothetical protein CLAC_03365 [Corynebacterium lactis RW2-5]
MTPTDQVRALEAELQHLRDALTAEQDRRRRYQGALNRAEDSIRTHLDNAISKWDDAHADGSEPGMTMYTQECVGLTYALNALDRARKEAEK